MQSLTPEQERSLVDKTLNGDATAYASIVEAHQNAIYNLAYRMLNQRTEAEEAAQETFMRAYVSLDRYDPARPLRAWLLSITSNYCIDLIRKRRLTLLSIEEPLAPHPSLVSEEPEPEEAALERERDAMIQALLNELQPEYRAAVVLRYWNDLSYVEIAELLNTTESAVKSRLFRARQALAERLIETERSGARTNRTMQSRRNPDTSADFALNSGDFQFGGYAALGLSSDL